MNKPKEVGLVGFVRKLGVVQESPVSESGTDWVRVTNLGGVARKVMSVQLQDVKLGRRGFADHEVTRDALEAGESDEEDHGEDPHPDRLAARFPESLRKERER